MNFFEASIIEEMMELTHKLVIKHAIILVFCLVDHVEVTIQEPRTRMDET